MASHKLVYFVMTLSTSFYLLCDSGRTPSDLILKIKDNNQIKMESIEIDSSYYYKNGANLTGLDENYPTVACEDKKYINNYLPPGHKLNLWYCNNYDTSYHFLTDCKFINQAITGNVVSRLLLEKADENKVIDCEHVNTFGNRLNFLRARLILQQESPTIIINQLRFDQSLSSSNIYEGTLGEKLKIVCQINETTGTIQWDYGEKSPGSSCSAEKINGMQIIYDDLELMQKHNNTEVKCVYKYKYWKMRETSVSFNVRVENKLDSTSFIANNYIWVVLGVGILIILILLLIIIHLCMKLKKAQQEMVNEDITYENQTNETPIHPTFPNSEKLENIYLNTPESQDNEKLKQAYNEANINNLYSKPHKKPLQNPTSQQAEKSEEEFIINNINYAEIETTPSSNNNMPVKSNIEYTTKLRLNPNYANVFVNESYVSAKDFIEPTYSEATYS